MLIAIGGWNEGSTKYSGMAKDPKKRAQFVNSTLDFIKEHNFDGEEEKEQETGGSGVEERRRRRSEQKEKYQEEQKKQEGDKEQEVDEEGRPDSSFRLLTLQILGSFLVNKMFLKCNFSSSKISQTHPPQPLRLLELLRPNFWSC